MSDKNNKAVTVSADDGDDQAQDAPKRQCIPERVAQQFANTTYWNSTEAASLFGKPETDVDASVTLRRRVQLFQQALSTSEGWKSVFEGADEEKKHCTDGEVFRIRNRLALLNQAYIYALDNMGNGKKSWLECCQLAIDHLGPSGNVQIKNLHSLAKLNILFRGKELFPHPNPKFAARKAKKRRRPIKKKRKDDDAADEE